MGKKEKVTSEEKRRIEQQIKQKFSTVNKAVEASKKYAVGDVLLFERFIHKRNNPNGGVYELEMYGEQAPFNTIPQKYEVVYKDSLGVAHYKSLQISRSDYLQSFEELVWAIENEDIKLLSDPDQLDAIMLEESYDPLAKLKKVNDERNERLAHNKKVKLSLSDKKACFEFINKVEVLDSYWVNPTTQYTCIKTEQMSVKNFIAKKYNTRGSKWYTSYFKSIVKANKIKMSGSVKVITWKTTSGKTLTHSYLDAYNGKFYTEKPQFMIPKKLRL